MLALKKIIYMYVVAMTVVFCMLNYSWKVHQYRTMYLYFGYKSASYICLEIYSHIYIFILLLYQSRIKLCPWGRSYETFYWSYWELYSCLHHLLPKCWLTKYIRRLWWNSRIYSQSAWGIYWNCEIILMFYFDLWKIKDNEILLTVKCSNLGVCLWGSSYPIIHIIFIYTGRSDLWYLMFQPTTHIVLITLPPITLHI